MNKGDKRRKKRKYRVRYDRVAAVLLALIVMIVVITSCVKGILKKDDSPQDDTSISDTEAPTDAPEIPPETTIETPITEIVPEITTTTTTQTTTTTTTTSETTTTTTATTKKQPIPEGYTEIPLDTEGIYSGNLITVNGNNIYHFPAEDINIVTLYDNIKTEYYGVSDFTVCLDKEVVEHLNQLMEDFAENQHNTDIVVIGGYRSAEDQNQRYNNGISGVIGGFSDYHTGRSFDMGVFPQDGSGSGYYSPTGIYSWIDEHASDYGFVVRYPEGKEVFTNERARTQTYRYVGVPHSTYMKQNNLCLEEYIEKLKSYTINKPLEISSGTNLYKVYYTASEDGVTTDVGVPLGSDYEISGNNQDGFIVSVKVY
ncbi:MAG: D-alanyl-D-alanine carboxypeptidase family protein [Ruminococcus sp.]|nr:D-alanyl-D-alanine carboxypeptidase family protein [Ruminococcus sp.]